jgi:demethylmenaquinone methyltransferase/2-methoxy-6-polyprenyl-1,4-benzoquinol methylase
VSDGTFDFGAERVGAEEKARRVRGVFDAVATRYDVVNDVMSLGMHRLLKRLTVELSAVRRGDAVLDLAGGTGDLAALFAPLAGRDGRVLLADINAAMLDVGRARLLDRGLAEVGCVQADAEALPFPDAAFDVACIGFGLRNVTRKERALSEMRRVLRDGGRALVLEFSHPRHALTRRLYGAWQGLWPLFGRVLTGDAAPYRYLVESIARHPDQETLATMLRDAGFARVDVHDLLDGVVALHVATR